MKVKELLSDESKWVKNNAAVRANNQPCNATAANAARWCLVGAVYKCYPGTEERAAARRKIVDTLEKHHFCNDVIGFNDSAETTFGDIRDVLEKADV